jgi:hypothetical protein
MKKPDSLRAALTATFPELTRDPNRLHLWIEEGQVRCHAADPTPGENLSFTLEYTLKVWIEKWRSPSILIWIVLLDWLRIQQPDLLTPSRSASAIPFETDLDSEKEADIGFDLLLRENITAVRRDDGGFDMQVLAEPDPLMPDTVPIAAGGLPLASIWLDGSQLVPGPLDAQQ